MTLIRKWSNWPLFLRDRDILSLQSKRRRQRVQMLHASLPTMRWFEPFFPFPYINCSSKFFSPGTSFDLFSVSKACSMKLPGHVELAVLQVQKTRLTVSFLHRVRREVLVCSWMLGHKAILFLVGNMPTTTKRRTKLGIHGPRTKWKLVSSWYNRSLPSQVFPETSGLSSSLYLVELKICSPLAPWMIQFCSVCTGFEYQEMMICQKSVA